MLRQLESGFRIAVGGVDVPGWLTCSTIGRGPWDWCRMRDRCPATRRWPAVEWAAAALRETGALTCAARESGVVSRGQRVKAVAVLHERERHLTHDSASLRWDGCRTSLDADVLGVESRGLLLGGAAAVELGVGFVAVRKVGGLFAGQLISPTSAADYRGRRWELACKPTLSRPATGAPGGRLDRDRQPGPRRGPARRPARCRADRHIRAGRPSRGPGPPGTATVRSIVSFAELPVDNARPSP